MGAEGHKAGDDESMKTVDKSPGIEGLWMTEKIRSGGEAGHNPPDDFIANIGGPRADKVLGIRAGRQVRRRIYVYQYGNGFSKEYAPKKAD